MSDPASIPPVPPDAPIPPIPSMPETVSHPVPPPPPSAPGSNLATPWIRLAAALIDGIVHAIVFLILSRIFFPAPDPAAIQAAVMQGDYRAIADAANPGFFRILIVSLVSAAVFIGINWKFLPNGQTIGKKLLNLQIQSRNGELLPVNDLITRRILPVYIVGRLGIIGSLLVIADALCIFRPAQNTLHDDFANSKVVVL